MPKSPNEHGRTIDFENNGHLARASFEDIIERHDRDAARRDDRHFTGEYHEENFLEKLAQKFTELFGDSRS